MPSQETSTTSQQQTQQSNTSGQQTSQGQQVTVVERGNGISIIWPSGHSADR